MQAIEYLKEIDNLPIPGERWTYVVETEHSGIFLQDMNIEEIILTSHLDKITADYTTMKVEVEIVYKCGHLSPSAFYKQITGLETAMMYIFQLGNHVQPCRECTTLFETNRKEGSTLCKDCRFFEFHDRINQVGEKTCSICQEPVVRFRLDCGHFFHIGCLSRLNKNQLRCPNCRAPISRKFLHRFMKKSSIKPLYCSETSGSSFSLSESEIDEEFY